MSIQLVVDESRPYREAIQAVGATLTYGTDWTDRLSILWAPNTAFAINVAIRTKPATGYQYVATVAGQSGQMPPIWPAMIGSTVQDGSITWSCAAIDNTSLTATISTSTWALDAGISTLNTSITGNKTAATIVSAAAVDGTDYYARNSVTMTDSQIEIAIFLIHVRNKKA